MTDPMNWSPLGDYKEFRSWSGRPRSWGPTDAGWRAWFGGKVIDGLCEVLDEHLAANRSGAPAAIGCVAYLTSRAVVDRLLKMAGLCVVIDKGAVLPPRQLVESDLGFPNTAIRALAEKTPAVGGKGMIVGPYTPREATEHELEPVRATFDAGRIAANDNLHQRLQMLIARPSPNPLSAIATSLSCRPDEVVTLLRRRGDTDLADLLDDESGSHE